ncbi:hypothetical protein LP420_41265 [Massilia sp. B-10]|nr:hypothetical protein LP420_41265 [Massilia sp. B-10]
MRASRFFALLLAIFLSLTNGAFAGEPDTPAKAKQVWQLLDYLAVDYSKAVENGIVKSPTEYAEMQEFARAAQVQLKALPAHPDQPDLLLQADALRTAIAAKATEAQVARRAQALADAVLASYPVPLAAKRA